MNKRLYRLAIFALVVEEGSFAGAARRLDRAPSAVSTHIAELEGMVGARLLHRTTRRLALTELGERYLPHAQSVLDAVRAADRLTARLSTTVSGPLRISAPTALIDALVVPTLRRLLDLHPKIEATVSATDARVDLRAGDVDVVVRVGRLTDLEDRARRLCVLHDVRVRRPDAPDRAIALPWQAPTPGAAGILRVASVNTATSMTRAGLGWSELPRPAVRGDIERGALEVLGEARPVPVYASHAFGARPPAGVRAFIDAAVQVAARRDTPEAPP